MNNKSRETKHIQTTNRQMYQTDGYNRQIDTSEIWKTNRVSNLQIQVYNIVLVQVLHPPADLPHEQAAVLLCQVEVLSGHSVKQLPTIEELCDDYYISVTLKSFNKLDNVWVRQLLQ